MDEKKIEVTEDRIFKATMDTFTSGELKKLVDGNPIMMLLAPIIGNELWKELIKGQEDNEDGREQREFCFSTYRET